MSHRSVREFCEAAVGLAVVPGGPFSSSVDLASAIPTVEILIAAIQIEKVIQTEAIQTEAIQTEAIQTEATLIAATLIAVIRIAMVILIDVARNAPAIPIAVILAERVIRIDVVQVAPAIRIDVARAEQVIQIEASRVAQVVPHGAEVPIELAGSRALTAFRFDLRRDCHLDDRER